MQAESKIISWRSYWLEEAKLKSKPSKDPSTVVGCIVIGSDNQILSSGFNGFPRGISDKMERYTNRDVKIDMIIHGEMNAICNATRTGTSLKDSTFYVYGLPVCSQCANMIIQVGVKEVVSLGNINERWIDSTKKTFQKFEEVGIPYTHYIGDNPEQLDEQINLLNWKEYFV